MRQQRVSSECRQCSCSSEELLQFPTHGPILLWAVHSPRLWVEGCRHFLNAMFALFNSCCVALTEYGGKWKMLHYYAKNFFNDVLISPIVNKNSLQVYFIQNPAILHQDWPFEVSGDDQPNLVIQCHLWNNFLAPNTLFIALNQVSQIAYRWNQKQHIYELFN